MNKVLSIVEQALDSLNKSKLSLSTALKSSIRVARLLNDFENLYFFEMEDGLRGDSLKDIQREIAAHFTTQEFDALHARCFAKHIIFRTIERLKQEGKAAHLLGFSVPEMEDNIKALEQSIKYSAPPPVHIESFDWMATEDRNSKLRNIYQESLQDILKIYERFKSDVFNYLSVSEKRLMSGEMRSDILLINKKFVEENLSRLNPKIIEQLNSASERAIAGDEESLSQSLTSCRRVLKSLADILYPPNDTPIKGRDGKERVLTDEKYISRIIQFINDSKSGSTSLNILVENFESFSKRIEDIYNVSSKGVHANVTKFEVFQCVEQLYLIIGDLLRLHEGNSALLKDLPDPNFQ